MTNELDLAAEREQIERDSALALHKKRMAARVGEPRCRICDEDISELRQGMGAVHCVEHAEHIERAGRRQ